MWSYTEADERTRAAMRGEILAFLDEYCRELSLRDVGQWYDDAFRTDDPPVLLNLP
jgi:hypothetical protein